METLEKTTIDGLLGSKGKMITEEETLELLEQIRSGKRGKRKARAREQVILANIGLPISIANKYRFKGMELCDLISEAVMGLMRAVDGFNPEKGGRFAGYASACITHALIRGIDNLSRTVRPSVSASEKYKATLKVIAKISNELGRDATPMDLAEALGISEEKAVKMLSSAPVRMVSVDSPTSTSWNVHSEGDEALTLLGSLHDETHIGQSPFEQLVHKEETTDVIAKMLDRLTERERQVIVEFFGLEAGTKARDMQVIGKRLKLSAERIRQVRNSAIEKMKAPPPKPKGAYLEFSLHHNSWQKCSCQEECPTFP